MLRQRTGALQARWLFVIGFLAMWLMLFVGAAQASDCPPDDPSRADCQGAASTARNPLVPLAGGAAGGVAGQVLGQAVGKRKPVEEKTGGETVATGKPGEEQKKEKKEEKAEERENPCQKAFDRFQHAKLNEDVLFRSYLDWQNTVKALDDLYWQTNKASYWSGVVDVGFLAGSFLGRPAQFAKGLAWKKFMSDNLKQKLMEAALKSMLKGSLKDMSQYWDPAKLPGKLSEDMGKKYLQEVLKKQMMTSLTQDYKELGFVPNKGLTEALSNNYVDPMVNFLGDTLSLYSTGMDALTNTERLEIIRMRLNAARDSLSNAKLALDEAISETALARDDYNNCTQGDVYQRYLHYLEFKNRSSQG
jgi:hypothetical protein